MLQPGAGGIGQLPVVAQPLPVRVDPLAQPRPARDERLVGELHSVVVGDQQPRLGQPPGDGSHFGVLPPGHFLPAERAARVGVALAGLDHPQEQVPGSVRLRRREFPVRLLGADRDRAAHPAGRFVRGQGQHPSLTPPPGLQQSMGQHRQSAGLVENVLDDPCGQCPLHDETGRLRGTDHRFAQFVGGHGPDQESAPVQRLRQTRVLGAPRVEVGPYRDEHAQSASRVARGEQKVEEAVPLGAFAAEGEDLLELIHHHPALRIVGLRCQQMSVGGGGPGSRSEDPKHRLTPLLRGLLPQQGNQTGPQQGGLAAAGRPEHHGERGPARELAQLVDQSVPAEEQLTVVRLETRETTVGRCGVGILLPPLPSQRLGLLPPCLPRNGVLPACPDVRLEHGQRRQSLAARRFRQGRHREAGLLRHGPVRDAPRRAAQLPKIVGQSLHGARRRVDR